LMQTAIEFLTITRAAILPLFILITISNVGCLKLKAWLGRNRFVGGIEPPGRNFGHMAQVNGLVFLHAGLQGSDFLDDMHIFNSETLEWMEITKLVAGDYPSGRYSHCYSVLEGVIYIFGGRDYSGNYLNDLYVFDPSNLGMTNLTNIARGQIPSGRGGAVFAAIDTRIFMFGGWQQSGEFFNDLFVLDVPTLTWENRTADTSGAIPPPRTSHGFLSHDGKLYVFGGFGYPAVRNDLFVLDPSTLAWTDLTPQAAAGAPSPRRDMAFFSFGGGIYVFGGKDAQGITGVVLNDLYRLDPKAVTWTRLSYGGVAPLKRAGASVSILGGYAYLFGGYVTSGSTTAYLNHLQRLDLNTLTWADVSDSLHRAPTDQRSCHGIASDGKRFIYSFGGSLGAASYIANLKRFDQDTFTWTSLSEDATPSPSPRRFHGMAHAENLPHLYVFGGWGQAGLLGDLYSFETAGMVWTNLTLNMKGDIPLPTKGHGFISSGSLLYAFGGFTDSGFSDRLYQLNPLSLEWLDLNLLAQGSFPVARSYHGFASLKGKLYTFGGWGISDFLNDILMFDPVTLEWIDLTQEVAGALPLPRAYHGFAALGEYLFAFAGWSASGLLNDLHRFDPQLLLWERLSNSILGVAPEPRYCNQLVTVARFLYSSGGINNSDSTVDGLDLIPTPVLQKWPQSNFLQASLVTVYDWDVILIDSGNSNFLMRPLELCTRGLPCALYLSGRGPNSRGILKRFEAGHISCSRSFGCSSVFIDSILFLCSNFISDESLLSIDGSQLQIRNSSFESCASSSDGSVVQALSESKVQIFYSRFENISSSQVGGAISAVGAHLQISWSEFNNCSSEMGGGAISAVNYSCSRSAGISSTIQIQSSSFRNCRSGSDGGAITSTSGVVSVFQSYFYGCTAQQYGGAIEARTGMMNVSFFVAESSFEGNSANGYGGGAISLSNVQSILASLNFTGNRAMNGGGGAVLWEGKEAILSCGPGYFLAKSSQSICYVCSGGKYQSEHGVVLESGCLSCIAGTYSYQGASVCLFCENGKFFTGQGGSSQSSCLRCPAGTFQTGSGMVRPSDCKMCPEGTYSSHPGASMCTSCEAGKYSSSKNSSTEADCESSCSPGQYSVLGSSSCLLCYPGKYSSAIGATSLSSCISCQSGTYSSFQMAIACIFCEAGKFSFHSASVCSECARGSYSSSPGSVSCSKCMPGTYSNRSGSTVCMDCDVGNNASSSVGDDSITVSCVSSRNDSLCTLNNRCLSPGCSSGILGRFVPGEVYNNDEEMIIILVSQRPATIVLTFVSFASEPDYDTLTVYSCTNATCEQVFWLGTLSGMSLPAQLNSSTGVMKLVWSSEVCCPKPSSLCFCDDPGKAKILTGWLAQYSILGPSACLECQGGASIGSYGVTCQNCSNLNLSSILNNECTMPHHESVPSSESITAASLINQKADQGNFRQENVRYLLRNRELGSEKYFHELILGESINRNIHEAKMYVHVSLLHMQKSSLWTTLISYSSSSENVYPNKVHSHNKTGQESFPYSFQPNNHVGLPFDQKRNSKRRFEINGYSIISTQASVLNFVMCSDSNEANYGGCMASSYFKLEVVGLPSTANPAFPGISFNLNVLKLDAYNHVIITDSSSIIQMYAVHSKDIEIGGGSAPTILGNSIIRMSRGQANFSVAIKPTYSNNKNNLQTPFAIQSSIVFFNGFDSYSYNAGQTVMMESDMKDIEFSNGSDICPLGFILSFDGADATNSHRLGKCSFCNPGTYSVSPLFSATSSGDPSCLDCPVSGNCSAGGSTVLFSQGEWSISKGIYLLTNCPSGYELLNAIGGVFSQAAQHCVLCPATFYCDGTTTRFSCPSGSFSLPGSNSSRDCKSAVFVQIVISLSDSITDFNVDKQSRFVKALAVTCGTIEGML